MNLLSQHKPMRYKIYERMLTYVLHKLGIGTGWNVQLSGEEVAFEFLFRQNSPLCVFDVGANVGSYASACLAYAGGGGTLLDSKNRLEIHCFEPSAFTFAKLSQTHANNPVIRLNNCALSNREEEAILYSDGDGSGLASLTKRRLDHFAIDFNKQENITLTTLDTYAMTHNIERIHLLKLDVEGHELDVLHGGLELFDQGKIDMVTFEFGGCNIDTRTFFQDFWYFFTEKNFLIFRILPRGKLLPITSYKETYEQFITTNYLAIRKEVRDSGVF